MTDLNSIPKNCGHVRPNRLHYYLYNVHTHTHTNLLSQSETADSGAIFTLRYASSQCQVYARRSMEGLAVLNLR